MHFNQGHIKHEHVYIIINLQKHWKCKANFKKGEQLNDQPNERTKNKDF